MSKLLPKSLVGQLLLIVAVILFIAQGINMFLLYRGMAQQNNVAASASAVTRMAVGLNRLSSAEEQPRRGARRGGRFRRAQLDFSDKPVVNSTHKRNFKVEERALQAFYSMGVEASEVRAAHYETLPPGLSDNLIDLPRMRPRTDAVGRNLGQRRPPVQIDGYVVLSTKLADGRWVNLASAVRNGEPFLIRTLIFQTVILYLLLLLPLILLGRYIAGPLKQLTQQAKSFGVGERDELRESGPPDTKQLIGAFNDMQSRVGAMLDEKDVMLGAIGHDLRTPLAALRVRVENVEDDLERSRMVAGIEDMARTLDDILSLARLGRSREKAEQNDLAALIQTVVNEFEDLGNTVEFQKDDKIPIKIRATLIRRALRNLIDNAVKYGRQTSISVDRSEGNLTIYVDDNGPGIPEEQLDAMFEPFTREEKSRNRATGGSGLGLTLARAIAREHGGEVELENRKEGGLRASLTLPM
ncbi:MAG: ATP-binding protein [Parasphingorhabdus sp.]